jgi:hypothetical protein
VPERENFSWIVYFSILNSGRGVIAGWPDWANHRPLGDWLGALGIFRNFQNWTKFLSSAYFHGKQCAIIITEMGWATFSQTHLVTLG